jgi:hypothetical protein
MSAHPNSLEALAFNEQHRPTQLVQLLQLLTEQELTAHELAALTGIQKSIVHARICDLYKGFLYKVQQSGVTVVDGRKVSLFTAVQGAESLKDWNRRVKKLQSRIKRQQNELEYLLNLIKAHEAK